MWLIDWLITRFTKLVNLLDTWYEQLRLFALYGIQWFIDQYNIAKKYASDVAFYYYNQALTFAVGIRDYLKGQIAYYYGLALDYARQKLQEAIAFAISVRDWLSGQIAYWHGVAKAFAQNLYNQAVAFVNSVRDWLLGQIAYWHGVAKNLITALDVALRGTIKALIAAALNTVTGWIGPLKIFMDKWGPFLLGFFNNPGAYIFGFIEIHAYAWFEWFIAYILGGVNIPLPLRPNLFGGGGGGGGGFPPPGGTGDLVFVWPTARHDISGYVFGPTHPGIDIGESVGDPIFASEAGVIIYLGWEASGYGNLIKIAHRDGWETRYAHLSAFTTAVGQNVVSGQLIGFAGSTGNSTGPHLHFEIRKDGTPYNPFILLN